MWEHAMTRKFIAVALAAACLVAFGANESAWAQSSTKSNKADVNKKPKAASQGSTAKTTPANSGTSTSYDRSGADCSFQ
jgi:hypothetical protein